MFSKKHVVFAWIEKKGRESKTSSQSQFRIQMRPVEYFMLQFLWENGHKNRNKLNTKDTEQKFKVSTLLRIKLNAIFPNVRLMNILVDSFLSISIFPMLDSLMVGLKRDNNFYTSIWIMPCPMLYFGNTAMIWLVLVDRGIHIWY